MSIVKARCLKCNEEIDVERDEDAGICPKCGSAYVTEKAIKHYNDTAIVKTSVDPEYEALSGLAKKYNAFVKLYKTDYDSFLELYRLRAEIRRREDELGEAIDKHNKMVDDRESWRERYNSRVDDYNDAKYNAYEASVSKSVHKMFVDSAKKKHDSINDKIKDSREDVDKRSDELKDLVKEEKALSEKVYAKNLEYNIKALAIVKAMCENYPANPLGYLYSADWYKREAERGKKTLKRIGETYDSQDRVYIEAEADAKVSELEQNAYDEYEKVEQFITDDFNIEYAALLAPLKKPTKPKKTNTVPDNDLSEFTKKSSSTPKKSSTPAKGGKAKGNAKGKASKARGASRASDLNWLASILCLLPIIAELVLVLIIPHIGSLKEIEYVACFGWNALSVPMKVAFLSVLIIGVLVQVLGLFDKLNNILGMFTQLVTFALYVLAVYAAGNNAASAYTQWGLAIMVPVSLIVGTLRYLSADRFGFIDDFGFGHYLPIALEVAEYGLFFLVFPLMFGASASLWMFIALTVITVCAIAVTSFWEDFRWIAVGINLVVAVLLCVVQWLSKLFTAEWLSSGGAFLVVILAVGGSIFIHWFIHRNDV